MIRLLFFCYLEDPHCFFFPFLSDNFGAGNKKDMKHAENQIAHLRKILLTIFEHHQSKTNMLIQYGLNIYIGPDHLVETTHNYSGHAL